MREHRDADAAPRALVPCAVVLHEAGSLVELPDVLLDLCVPALGAGLVEAAALEHQVRLQPEAGAGLEVGARSLPELAARAVKTIDL